MTIPPHITVNGVTIAPQNIMQETQHHPAESLFSAQYYATRALIIRELLIQRAQHLYLCQADFDKADENDIIESLIDQEVSFPEADDTICHQYYRNNPKRFMTSPLFEVSHILYLAPADNKLAQDMALMKAKIALKKIKQKPVLFPSIAKQESACSSAKEGGRIGQISQGQTLPEFEKALFKMRAGDISKTPVLTSVGYHIIKVDEWAEGHALAYAQVGEWIKDYLERKNQQKALQQYIRILAGQADIRGFTFESATSPLVQ